MRRRIILSTVHFYLSRDAKPTEEQIKRLKEAAKRPHVYDPECPPTPPEILERNTMLRQKYNTRRITKEILIAEGYIKPKTE